MNRTSTALLATAALALTCFPGGVPNFQINDAPLRKGGKRGRGGGKGLTRKGETYAERVQRACREKNAAAEGEA